MPVIPSTVTVSSIQLPFIFFLMLRALLDTEHEAKNITTIAVIKPQNGDFNFINLFYYL
jgi:hypothetical protein